MFSKLSSAEGRGAINPGPVPRRLTLSQRGIIKNLLEEKQREAAQDAVSNRDAAKDAQEGFNDFSLYGTHAEAGSATDSTTKAIVGVLHVDNFLKHIEAARVRMKKKGRDFDLCDSCGRPIGFRRLKAVPITGKCISCKNGNEKKLK